MSKGMEKYQFDKFQDALFLTMESNGCESFLATMEAEAKGFMDCVLKELAKEAAFLTAGGFRVVTYVQDERPEIFGDDDE